MNPIYAAIAGLKKGWNVLVKKGERGMLEILFGLFIDFLCFIGLRKKGVLKKWI